MFISTLISVCDDHGDDQYFGSVGKLVSYFKLPFLCLSAVFCDSCLFMRYLS